MRVHILCEGFPICGFSDSVPGDWPAGDLWVRVEEADQATCVGCRQRAVLSVWVIYDHPRDYPEHFVLRRQDILPGRVAMGPATLHASLEEARKAVPAGLHNLGRQPEDDRVIVETWV